MQELAEFGEEMFQQLEQAMELLEGMEFINPHMDEEDLEELKRKHRNQEEKAMVKADMDYLKEMIKRELMKDGRYAAQALLYHPYEELAAYSTVAKAEPAEQSMALERALHRLNGELLSRQIGFDFINQEMLLQCRFADGKILTPCGETPSILIFPPISFAEAPLARTIAQALKAGVRVLIDGPRRKIEGLDDLPSDSFDGSDIY